jgi:hypothetical protein
VTNQGRKKWDRDVDTQLFSEARDLTTDTTALRSGRITRAESKKATASHAARARSARRTVLAECRKDFMLSSHITHRRCLTQKTSPSSLIGMRFARLGIVAALTIALAAYAVDCVAATPQQAMQCCHSMQCSSQAHRGMDCCKTMPSARVALGQPSSAPIVSSSPSVVGVLAILNCSSDLEASAARPAPHSHAPPGSFSPPVLALRI